MKKNAEDNFDLNVSQAIRTYRRLRGVTQTELGQELGVTFQQIQKYENAKNKVSIGTFNQIRKRLNIPLEELFDDSSPISQSADLKTDVLTNLKLLRAFADIKKQKTRDALLELILILAKED